MHCTLSTPSRMTFLPNAHSSVRSPLMRVSRDPARRGRTGSSLADINVWQPPYVSLCYTSHSDVSLCYVSHSVCLRVFGGSHSVSLCDVRVHDRSV